MLRVLFVCHGNICRSPMAESMFTELLKKRGLDDKISCNSAATSMEEIGNPVHQGARKKLAACGIPLVEHRAIRMIREDYRRYNYLLGMDSQNLRNMRRIAGSDREKKLYRLLDFTENPRDIADPWYTGNFDATYEDIAAGLDGLLTHIFAVKKEL